MALSVLFDIGKSGLLSYQKALEVVSHNIANAATEGYTRQDVIFENITSGIFSYMGISGRGVRIADIRRLYDSFIELQIKTESSRLAYWDVFQNGILRLESIFNEASEVALTDTINDFFNAWQEVSQNPSGTAQRHLLLNKANYLAQRINTAYKALIDERQEIYKDAVNLVNIVNSCLDQINELNEKIVANPGALDIKDQRESLVKKLNDIVGITYFEDATGRYSILVGGTPLVEAGKVYHLNVTTDFNQNLKLEVKTPSATLDITHLIQSGKLKAEIDLRDSIVLQYMNKLNMFVFDLTEAINQLHRQGYGLDGSTGNNFFKKLYNLDVAQGTVDSEVVFKINSVNSNSYHKYQISFDGNIWTVIDNSTTPPTNITPQVTSWSIGSDIYYKLSFNEIEITLRNPSVDLILNFQIRPNTALYFEVEITNPDKIAAAAEDPTSAGGVMDNRNAKAIYSLIEGKIIGNATPIDFYRSIVSEIGVYSSGAKTQKSFQEAMVQEMQKRRQDISGVSLDEEAVNLIKFQKMYEASARVIRVADEILATLFEMVK
ncbi:MAG: flagellar hook-associated protein FlgK [Thermodesulfovibrio sp.]|nr:flagellar hook-associated protein FlgK [Thermodesulfovibrio sp.]